MTAELKRLLTNKLAIIVMVLTLFWLMLDSFSRFSNKASSNIVEEVNTNITPLALPVLSRELVAQLSLKYKQYSTEKAVDLKGLSAEEQAKQQGLLKSLFIGDNKLVLKAVIQYTADNSAASRQAATEQTPLIALIQVTNVKTGQSGIEKFKNNQQVYGYQLTIEKNTQVVLTKQIEQTKQTIILTMYKNERPLP